jgi:hypothetical protein
VPEAFWGALTCGESGRYLIHNLSVPPNFEPKVYHYFEDVLHGISLSYAGVKQVELEVMGDAEIRALSSSHGLTQVMGYQAHVQRRPVADLEDPEKHYPIAAGVLVGFLNHFGLDPQVDFAAMATCWNAGNPNGVTTDPEYVSNLLLRKAIWEALG